MFVDKVESTGLVTVDTTAPAGPLTGDLWMNGGVLSIWDGLAWEVVTGAAAAAGGSITVALLAPVVAKKGDGWFDTKNKLFKVFDGANWLEEVPTHNGGRY